MCSGLRYWEPAYLDLPVTTKRNNYDKKNTDIGQTFITVDFHLYPRLINCSIKTC